MKELTTEQKAQRYDKAKSIMEKYLESGNAGVIAENTIKKAFPELEENEDEKIRKALIEYFNEQCDMSNWNGIYGYQVVSWLEKQGEQKLAEWTKKDEEIRKEIIKVLKGEISFTSEKTNEKYIAWLEKQGKQKPVVIIPKFRVGCEIKSANEEPLTITRIDEKGYWSGDLFICDFDDAKWEIVEQKPTEWHREDEQNLNACLGYIPDEFLRRWLIDIIYVKYNETDNKIEPKFHEGEWITSGDYTWKIVDVTLLGYRLQSQDGNIVNDMISYVDKQFHSFTIKDAKNGDVLYSKGCHEDCIFIFDKLDNWTFDELNGKRAVATGYCCLTLSEGNMQFCIGGPDCIDVDTITPATKEQRDLLFQAIKESRFEWDSEKKELKLKELANQEEVKPSDQENSEWNVKDAEMLSILIELVESKEESMEVKIELIDWLKSLKGHILSQPKQEWSSRDEVIRNHALHIILNYLNSLPDSDYDKNEISEACYNWIKSFKPRTNWKPTPEQYKVLNRVINFAAENPNPYWHDTIFNSLKQLRMELKAL